MLKNKEKLFLLFHGRIDSKVGVGVNRLIKEGAKLTTKIEDILECYPQFKNRKRIIITKKQQKEINIRPEYKEIYNILVKEEANLEEIVQIIGVSTNEILEKLTKMELDDIIERKDNGNWGLK